VGAGRRSESDVTGKLHTPAGNQILAVNPVSNQFTEGVVPAPNIGRHFVNVS
jgi:hypothetical protein